MSNLSGSSNSGMHQGGFLISTLYIGPLDEELKHCEIFSHFSAFGDVQSVRILRETNHSYGLVTFTLAESTAKALRTGSHVIGGRRVWIAVAGDRHHDMPTLLDLNDDKTSLFDLNDDCILEILSMECLSVIDLCAVAESCRRLKEIASRVFKREHKQKELDIRSLSEGETRTAKRILTHFGSEISDLKIWGVYDEWSREILASVAEHCSTTLRSLFLDRYLQIHENQMANLRPLFKNLQKLKIVDCDFVGATKELFADCGSLVELNLHHCIVDVVDFIYEQTFPKLERFESDWKGHLLESFIPRHMNLKSLKIIFCYVDSFVLKFIAGCKQLETLQCRIGKNATLDLSNLGHLRELDLDFAAMATALKLENLKFLEHLTLKKAKIDSKFIDALSQLERLQVLKLQACTGLQNFNQIDDLGQLTTLEIHSHESDDLDIALLVKRFSKLNSLNVAVCLFKMDLQKYLSIVDVVRQRRDGLKVTFELASYGNNYQHLVADFSRNAHLVEMITTAGDDCLLFFCCS